MEYSYSPVQMKVSVVVHKIYVFISNHDRRIMNIGTNIKFKQIPVWKSEFIYLTDC